MKGNYFLYYKGSPIQYVNDWNVSEEYMTFGPYIQFYSCVCLKRHCNGLQHTIISPPLNVTLEKAPSFGRENIDDWVPASKCICRPQYTVLFWPIVHALWHVTPIVHMTRCSHFDVMCDALKKLFTGWDFFCWNTVLLSQLQLPFRTLSAVTCLVIVHKCLWHC